MTFAQKGHPFISRPDWPTLAAFGLPLILYLLTLAPTIYNLDSAELTTAAVTSGITRATGYPLYLILGKMWSWLPFGDMGYRMNLFSAVCGATTILLAERILRHLHVGPWARFGALGLLASAYYFWALSLIAEVYTLHTALMAGVVLLLLRWAEAPSPVRLAWPILLATLSLGNHAATTLLIPGYIWYVLASHPHQLCRPRVLAAGFVAAVAGATVYLYLPLRYSAQPAFNYAGHYDATGTFIPVNLQTLDGFLWLTTGRGFAGFMFGYQPAELWPQVQDFAVQLWRAFFALGIGPGIPGIFVLLRRNWRMGVLLLLLFFAHTLFFINYRAVDKDTMFLPSYLIWTLWLGVGYQVLVNWTQQEPGPRIFTWLVRGLIVGAVLVAVGWNWRLVNLSGDWSTREQSEAILRQVEPGALIFGWWDTIPGVQYLQLVEGERPDVTTINRFLISGSDMNQLILHEMEQQPVYVDSLPFELLGVTMITPVGALYRIEPQESTFDSRKFRSSNRRRSL
ncbi:MAG TPA: DUF2723 domain-containing protein [Anaerolineae bacterium]